MCIVLRCVHCVVLCCVHCVVLCALCFVVSCALCCDFFFYPNGMCVCVCCCCCCCCCMMLFGVCVVGRNLCFFFQSVSESLQIISRKLPFSISRKLPFSISRKLLCCVPCVMLCRVHCAVISFSIQTPVLDSETLLLQRVSQHI